MNQKTRPWVDPTVNYLTETKVFEERQGNSKNCHISWRKIVEKVKRGRKNPEGTGKIHRAGKFIAVTDKNLSQETQRPPDEQGRTKMRPLRESQCKADKTVGGVFAMSQKALRTNMGLWDYQGAFHLKKSMD